MRREKVIAKINLPARFPFGLATFLLWIGDKIDSTVFYLIIGLILFLTAGVVMFRQMTEYEVELKDLQHEKEEETIDHH